MELFLAEHKKLWSRKNVRVSVFICFVYMVVFAGILQFQWFTFGSRNDFTSVFGNNFDGYDVIRERQGYSEKYGHLLTDDTLAEMVSDYQYANEYGTVSDTRKMDWSVISTWLETLYPEQKKSSLYKYASQLMLDYVDTEKLTDIYGRRQEAIETFMEASGITGEKRRYLLSLNDKVKIPFSYVWTEGWRTVLGDSLPEYGLMIAIVLMISLAPLFSGEWRDRTGDMILTMKHGWEKDAVAKFFVGFVFTLEIFLLIAIPSIIVQITYMGISGWDEPIQCIKMIAIAPMNMMQAEIYEYIHALSGALGFAGIMMLISASSKNELLSLVGGFAFLFGPLMISEYLPYTIQLLISLLPIAGSASDIFRMDTLNIFGKIVWMPYAELLTPIIIMVVCIPATVKRWIKMKNG